MQYPGARQQVNIHNKCISKQHHPTLFLFSKKIQNPKSSLLKKSCFLLSSKLVSLHTFSPSFTPSLWLRTLFQSSQMSVKQVILLQNQLSLIYLSLRAKICTFLSSDFHRAVTAGPVLQHLLIMQANPVETKHRRRRHA